MNDRLLKESDVLKIAFQLPLVVNSAFYDAVKALPSEERPQGEWINHFDDLFPEESTIECSICHEHQPIGIDENYCPNCGARMKGARKNEKR